MLNKLLKHEFRATGRILVPVLGVVALLIVMANLSVRLVSQAQSGFLSVLCVLVIVLAFIGVILSEIVPVIVMVIRFYRNLLSNEGYLMHTLPVNVHGLVWSKLIVSLVWVLITNLVLFLMGALSALIQAGTDLAEIFRGFPTLAQLADMLPGVTKGDLTLLLVEIAVLMILAGLVSCLHFYAAMSLGHMFSKDKILLSVVFFVVIQIVFNMVGNLLGLEGIRRTVEMMTAVNTVHSIQTAGAGVMLLLALQGAVLYLLTVLGLRKGLNLA